MSYHEHFDHLGESRRRREDDDAFRLSDLLIIIVCAVFIVGMIFGAFSGGPR